MTTMANFQAAELVHPPESVEVITRTQHEPFSRKAYYQEGKWFDAWHRPVSVDLWKWIKGKPLLYDHPDASYAIRRIVKQIELGQL